MDSSVIQSYPKICASVGSTVNRLVVEMHNAGFRAQGLDFTYIYFATADLKDVIRNVRCLGIRGLGVTMPFKETIAEYIDQIDPIAREIGAINTVVNDNGILKGFNYDWLGAVEALQNEITLKGKKALIYGSGGVARALIYGLKSKGVIVLLTARRYENALTLASKWGIQAIPFNKLLPEEKYDILINATPVGSVELPRLPFPQWIIESSSTILDVVVNPPRTPLCVEAEKIGVNYIPGVRMLLYQAAHQFAAYTGMEAPIEEMKSEIIKLIGLF